MGPHFPGNKEGKKSHEEAEGMGRKKRLTTEEMKNGGWLWMPKSVIREFGKELGVTGLAVYTVLRSYPNNAGITRVSLRKIAEELSCDKNTVLKAIRKLAALGLIDVRSEPGTKTRIIFNTPESSEKTQGAQSVGIDQTLSENKKQVYEQNRHLQEVSEQIRHSVCIDQTPPKNTPSKPLQDANLQPPLASLYSYREKDIKKEERIGEETSPITPPSVSPLADRKEEDKKFQLGEETDGKEEGSSPPKKSLMDKIREIQAAKQTVQPVRDLNELEDDPAEIKKRAHAAGITDPILIDQIIQAQLLLAEKRRAIQRREEVPLLSEVIAQSIAEGGDGDGE
jgi:DNA-binding MarR family transcriptional regulator